MIDYQARGVARHGGRRWGCSHRPPEAALKTLGFGPGAGGRWGAATLLDRTSRGIPQRLGEGGGQRMSEG